MKIYRKLLFLLALVCLSPLPSVHAKHHGNKHNPEIEAIKKEERKEIKGIRADFNRRIDQAKDKKTKRKRK